MFQSLNQSAYLKPIIGSTKLVPHRPYRIYSIYKKTTKYGDAVFVDIGNCKVALPQRFVRLLSEAQIEMVNNKIQGEDAPVVNIISLGPVGRTTNIFFQEEEPHPQNQSNN